MTDEWNRRRFLTTLSLAVGGSIAGCQSNSGDATQTGSVRTSTQTPVDTPTSTSTATAVDTDEEIPTRWEPPTEYQSTAVSVDAEEIYQESVVEREFDQINDGELTFDLDTSEPITQQIEEAALRGADKGELFLQTTDYGLSVNATTHYAAAKAVEQSVDHDVDAMPHKASIGGNIPAVVFEYENEDGEKQSDFQNAQDIGDDMNPEETNWYTKNWLENTLYWADTGSAFHPLNFSNLTTEPIDMGNNFPDKMKEPLQKMLNSLPTNSYELNVNIRFGSAEAWKEAEKMVSEKSLREFIDIVNIYANSGDIENLELIRGDESRLVGKNVSDENYQGPLKSIQYNP